MWKGKSMFLEHLSIRFNKRKKEKKELCWALLFFLRFEHDVGVWFRADGTKRESAHEEHPAVAKETPRLQGADFLSGHCCSLCIHFENTRHCHWEMNAADLQDPLGYWLLAQNEVPFVVQVVSVKKKPRSTSPSCVKSLSHDKRGVHLHGRVLPDMLLAGVYKAANQGPLFIFAWRWLAEMKKNVSSADRFCCINVDECTFGVWTITKGSYKYI